jgi:signal transduction histidine kinase
MLRRSLPVITLLAAATTLVGVALSDDPALAVASGALAGLVVGVALDVLARRRVERAAAAVRAFADGTATGRVELHGAAAWRQLAAALSVVGLSVSRQLSELERQRARVERLLENLPTAVLLFDDTGLAYANPAAAALFGLDGGSQGRSPMQVLGIAGLAGAVSEAREAQRLVEVEVGRDDQTLVGRATLTTAGEVSLAVTDLTELRRLDAIRRDFVTNASHELKTPVAGMQALADSLALAVDRDPQRARALLARLRRESVRMATLVRELLDLARLEEASAARTRQHVGLADVVAGQVDRLAGAIADRDLRVEVTAPPDAGVVILPEDLRLIVGNLIENAVLYNDRGGRVGVAVTRAGGHVTLEVSDTGIGIAEADRDRVFERFYRVDKARSRAAGGTGLGLSIVRHAVQRHGGWVSVDSVLGEGSTFRVVLPVEGSGAGR